MSNHDCTEEKPSSTTVMTSASQYSFWLYRDEKIESLNLFIRPTLSRDIYDLKLFFNECTLFQRASIDFSMYFYAFRPRHSFVVVSRHGVLGHGSIKQWHWDPQTNPSVMMLGIVYVRSDYRKFGIGELITNYLINLKSNETERIHTNVSTKHLPFYIRYGFQASFSIVGLMGKLSEFLNLTNIVEDDIQLQLFESCDILDVATYDHQFYPTYRIQYFEQLREHTYSIAGYVARSIKTNTVLGYAILNFSQAFIKCGPLYANNMNIALLLLRQCAADYDGMMLLSLPEDNRTAVKMFESKYFKRTDTLHRVYTGNENIFHGKSFDNIWAITDDWLSLI